MFHMTGPAAAPSSRFAAQGWLAGVLDVTTTELADELAMTRAESRLIPAISVTLGINTRSDSPMYILVFPEAAVDTTIFSACHQRRRGTLRSGYEVTAQRLGP